MARQTHHRSRKKRAKKSNQQVGRLLRNAAPLEVSIDHIGGRGDGVGKILYTHNYHETEHDIFVPASLPGERLSVRPLSLTAQGIKAQIIEIISPSPDRLAPRCDVFPACGGCRFQHWGETAIRNWKQRLVTTFLHRSNVPMGDMRPLYGSPPESRRRASFHLKCLGRRNWDFVNIWDSILLLPMAVSFCIPTCWICERSCSNLPEHIFPPVLLLMRMPICCIVTATTAKQQYLPIFGPNFRWPNIFA